ncbi:DNA repair protein RadC [Tenacibaculum aiptasiae]|uniref:DNA repair protein RadC n=1 Tax=Tenacibaculum aiptasiae TaxID=426481 RepID=A0A7J5ACM8_9FLAO|nr:DNA repair protein RadC [Tenacibaculum aiptasiae]KAB1155218.1 DNA repair protein RadC [Tenacibaculum aiptasiae]
MKKIPIKLWAIDDMPRKKLRLKGKNSLSNAELIAILIGAGNRQESAVELAKRILLSVDNDLNSLSKLSVPALMKFNGIGEAKAIAIVSALEFGRRKLFMQKEEELKIYSSKNVFNIIQPLIGDIEHEEFWALYLNNSNVVLEKFQISKGGFTATLVDIRLLYKRALELSAVGIIVCHNHPSGKLEPSNSDIELTKKIKNAGDTLNIKLLDHIIVTEKTYFSFADEMIL